MRELKEGDKVLYRNQIPGVIKSMFKTNIAKTINAVYLLELEDGSKVKATDKHVRPYDDGSIRLTRDEFRVAVNLIRSEDLNTLETLVALEFALFGEPKHD